MNPRITYLSFVLLCCVIILSGCFGGMVKEIDENLKSNPIQIYKNGDATDSSK
jgi:hypothetical protein